MHQEKKEKAKIIAVIPARGGSKGVPKKNIFSLAGYPLVAYSIAAAVLSKKIERVIISTDSEEIAGIARLFGAEAPFLRPAEFAGDKSTDMEFIAHLMNWFKTNEGHVPEYLVHLRPTTPLRSPDIIDQAIEEIASRRESTSLRSGHPASESPFKWFLKNREGFFKGILEGYSNEDINLPRQSFPEVYIPDGYVDVIKTSYVLKSGRLHGEKMIGFVSPECVEVDSADELEHLQYQLDKRGNLLLDYLKNNFKGVR